MDDKYTLSATPVPTVEQQNRAWQDFHNDMNDLIKRYDIPILDGMMIGDGDDPNGEWVRYDDHAAALADAQATIARLEAALSLASKRLSACARTLDRESEMHKAALWAEEARAALSHGKGGSPNHTGTVMVLNEPFTVEVGKVPERSVYAPPWVKTPTKARSE